MRGTIAALVGFVCLAAMGSDVRMQTFPDGARVAFFGDSITRNGGAMLRTAAHYRTAFPDRDVRFYNVGISGGGLAAAEMYFDKYLAAIKPTHVVFAFGVNDSDSPDGFRERYAALVGRIAALGASVILRTTTPYNEFGKGTAAVRKGRNEAHRKIADEIRALAEERRLPVLDDFSRMSKFLADGEEVFSDDRLHPNDYGQWRMADTLLAAQGQKIAVFQPLDEVAASSGLEAWHAQSQKLADILSCEWLLVRDETLDLDAKLAKVRTWLETAGARPDANRFMVGLAHRYSDDKPRETAIRADMDAAWDNIVARCRSRCMETASGVTGDEYLDLVEAAVAAYPDEHVEEYIDDADRNGVHEHGFPRLTANIAALVSAGRHREWSERLRRMMDICCRDAKKGPMKKEGNEFSVKELVAAVLDLEKARIFANEVTDGWRRDLSDVDPWRCYREKPDVGDTNRSYNWCIFGCASEQMRLSAGMGGDRSFVERYVPDQMRWFDENSMWRDPHEPFVYDFVTRLQYAIILSAGYDGPMRAELERRMDAGIEPTLAMQSAAGEIPYGGRSNQFLHNDTLYAALCEWYAARLLRRGDSKTAARFRSAAARAVASVRRWIDETPVCHVKNRYPRSWRRGSGIGCESYAYYDKYMVTMGSWAVLARRFAIDEQLQEVEEEKTLAFETSPFFHCVFLRAGDYSAQFDYNADEHYDCDGLGRLHRKGAPTQICISTPCAAKPGYSTEIPNVSSLAIIPVSDAKFVPAGSGRDGERAWAKWRLGELEWVCCLSGGGLSASLRGSGGLAVKLPAFAFDGAAETEIRCDGKRLSVRYRGWECAYETDGEITDTGTVCCNRNGRYRVFEARGTDALCVKAVIRPIRIGTGGERTSRDERSAISTL